MTSCTHFPVEQIEFAIAVALLAVQQSANSLGLPRTTQKPWIDGAESDSELDELVESLGGSHAGNALADQLLADLYMYRLVRAPMPACAVAAATRRRYIEDLTRYVW
ncbi:MAG: hypothetical protein ACOH2T_29245 [Pseudomonas sp.]